MFSVFILVNTAFLCKKQFLVEKCTAPAEIFPDFSISLFETPVFLSFYQPKSIVPQKFSIVQSFSPILRSETQKGSHLAVAAFCVISTSYTSPQVRRHKRFARQNLGTGRIHFARACKIALGAKCRFTARSPKRNVKFLFGTPDWIRTSGLQSRSYQVVKCETLAAQSLHRFYTIKDEEYKKAGSPCGARTPSFLGLLQK